MQVTFNKSSRCNTVLEPLKVVESKPLKEALFTPPKKPHSHLPITLEERAKALFN